MATTATVSAPGYGSALMNAVRSFALLRESVVGMAGTALVLFWATLAIGAPLFAPCDPNATLQAFARPGTPIPIAGACWTDTFVLGGLVILLYKLPSGRVVGEGELGRRRSGCVG